MLKSSILHRRVQGLARSTDLLIAGGVAGVELRELLEAQIEPQKKQAEAQTETNRILEKVISSSTEHRQKIRTEVPKVRAKDASSLFFEVSEFEDAMDELQIGPAQASLRYRSGIHCSAQWPRHTTSR